MNPWISSSKVVRALAQFESIVLVSGGGYIDLASVKKERSTGPTISGMSRTASCLLDVAKKSARTSYLASPSSRNI